MSDLDKPVAAPIIKTIERPESPECLDCGLAISRSAGQIDELRLDLPDDMKAETVKLSLTVGDDPPAMVELSGSGGTLRLTDVPKLLSYVVAGRENEVKVDILPSMGGKPAAIRFVKFEDR